MPKCLYDPLLTTLNYYHPYYLNLVLILKHSTHDNPSRPQSGDGGLEVRGHGAGPPLSVGLHSRGSGGHRWHRPEGTLPLRRQGANRREDDHHRGAEDATRRHTPLPGEWVPNGGGVLIDLRKRLIQNFALCQYSLQLQCFITPIA